MSSRRSPLQSLPAPARNDEEHFRECVVTIVRGYRILESYLGGIESWEGVGRLSINSMRMLRLIAESDAGLQGSVLQERLALTSSHKSHILRDLVDNGLVTRQAVPWNRRSRIYAITPLGASLATDFDEAVHLAAQRIVARWHWAVRDSVASLLKDVERNLHRW